MAEKPKGEPFEGVLVGDLKDWARGKTIEDLAAVELDGETLIPETIARWDFKAKQLRECQVYVRLHNNLDLVRARIEALAMLAKEAKRDPTTFGEQEAIRLFGVGRWEAVERVYIYARLLRKRHAPKEPYMTAVNLDECHPNPALEELDQRIATATRLLDRRLHLGDLARDPTQLWALLNEIARRSNLSPLVVIAGHDHDSLIVFMAQQAVQMKAEIERLEATVLALEAELATFRTKPSSQPSPSS